MINLITQCLTVSGVCSIEPLSAGVSDGFLNDPMVPPSASTRRYIMEHKDSRIPKEVPCFQGIAEEACYHASHHYNNIRLHSFYVFKLISTHGHMLT